MDEVVDECANALGDLVADGLDAFAGGEGGIADRPVVVADAGNDGADVATPHGDDDVGCADGIVGERLRESLSSPVTFDLR